MIDQARILVNKQVRRVQRRLFTQVIVQKLVLSLAAALLAATVWFLVWPLAFAGLGESMRWTVPALLLGAGVLGGLILAWLRRPNLAASSLALDERFGLQERVTTLSSLKPEHLNSPAGQALLQDVTLHLEKLEVTSRFPLRISPRQCLMSAGALVLAVIACVLGPVLNEWQVGSRTQAEQPRQAVDAKKIQEQQEKLEKSFRQGSQDDAAKSDKQKALEKEIKDLISQPLDTKNEEKVRERVLAMRNLLDKMKENLHAEQEKAKQTDLLKKHLEKLALDKDTKLKDGPAKDFEDALMRGDFNKARETLKKLVNEMKNGKLSKSKQKELAEQFKLLQDKMKRVMENDDLLKQLKQDLKDGKKNADLQRELQNLKDLQDLTDVLGECTECLGKAGGLENSEKLKRMLDRFEQIELTEREIRDLLRDQDVIDNAAEAMMEAVEGDGNGEGEGGGRAGGKRRVDPNNPNSKLINQRQNAAVNPKSPQRLSGYAKGGNFNKISAEGLKEHFNKAAQDAPGALDRQPIPPNVAEISRGYFEQLRKEN